MRRLRPSSVPLLLTVLTLAACGGEPLPEPRSRAPADGSELDLPKGSLSRADVIAVVDAGLGRFLQRVRVEPSLEEGRFVGFRVLELVPPGFWAQTDLEPGDVVTHVNETPIENPERAHAVFESLREAQVLKVRVLREGQERFLTFRIVGAKPKSKAAPAPDTATHEAD